MLNRRAQVTADHDKLMTRLGMTSSHLHTAVHCAIQGGKIM